MLHAVTDSRRAATSRRRPGLERALRALAAGAAMAVVGGCAHDSTGTIDDLGLPPSGTYAGTVAAGDTSEVRFVAPRAGDTRIKVCGPAGTNFDLYLTEQGRRAATAANCDSLTFAAEIGRTYHAEVIASAGAGPFNFCWAALGVAGATCTADVPVAGDSTVPPGYYATAEGLTGTALLQALNDIIDNQRVLGYTSARDSLYANVTDPDNNDTIPELYVGNMRGIVNSRSTALTAGLNTEHAWPQSRGANEDPANSDLNILFPADSIANRERSNFPFGEVAGDTLYATPIVSGDRSVLGYAGPGTSGGIVFEPRNAVKGDVARALLYFYVRYYYDRTPSFSLSNFNVEEATLIRWAKQDLPDEYEKARNRLVYRAQGNRNPFIDRMDFLDAIGDFPNQ